MTNKRVSIKDVAVRAGVSYQTVSKVLNGELKVSPATEARISASVKELGYRPNHSARTLRTQRSQMIGYSWSSSETEQLNHIVHMFLTGVVSEADLVRKAMAHGKDPAHTSVRTVMSSPLITIEIDRSAHDASDLMAEHGIRHLPITQDGQIVGMVSVRDLLRYFKNWGTL